MQEEKKNGIKRIGYVFMVVGILLIAASIALVLYNRNEDANAGNAADDVLPVLQEVIENGTDDDDPEQTGKVNEYDMPVAMIDGYEYIGYLSIPVLELDLPVMADWDYTRLKIAPCRYFGSTETDDLVICGHNYDRHFGRLKNLQSGDMVTFTQMDGVTIVYEVEAVETLQPTEISEMIESDYDLSLYTCTYGGQSRVTVRCNRVKA